MFGFRTKLIFFGYVYFVVLSLMAYFFKLHFVPLTFLFIVVPTVLLIYLKRGIGREVFLFSFSLGIPIGLYVQVIAERNFVWKYAPFLELFKLKDIPLEAVLWYPAWFGLVIATYLYFFDKHKHIKNKNFLKTHLKYFGFISLVFVLSILLIFVEVAFFKLPYAYMSLVFPIVLLSIFLYAYHRHRHFIKTFIPTTLVLFLPMLIYDLIGVYANQWYFPGQYLYSLGFGFASLPLEEFIIWLWLAPASVIAYFEEFEKDFN
jgi:hypothetical protein